MSREKPCIVKWRPITGEKVDGKGRLLTTTFFNHSQSRTPSRINEGFYYTYVYEWFYESQAEDKYLPQNPDLM